MLGICRNIPKQLRRIHHSFRGFSLCDFNTEQTIERLRLFIQHYESGTELSKKLKCTLQLLQLEIGSIGCPLTENYTIKGPLATDSWIKALWKLLKESKIEFFINYPTIKRPRVNDRTLVDVFIEMGYKDNELKSLNTCRIAKKLFFLSDCLGADGKIIEDDIQDKDTIIIIITE